MNTDSILVVIGYPDDSAAQAAQERLRNLSTEDLIELEVAMYLTKDAVGKVKLHESQHRAGIRRIFGQHSESSSIDDNVVQDSAQTLEPGGAALFLLVRSVTPEKVVPEISKYGGTLIKTSLPADREQRLKEALAGQIPSDMNR